MYIDVHDWNTFQGWCDTLMEQAFEMRASLLELEHYLEIQKSQHLNEIKECEKRADHWHDEWQKVSAKLNEVENEFTALKEKQPVSDKWFDAYESLLASYIRLWNETESLKKRNKRLSDFIVAWIKP